MNIASIYAPRQEHPFFQDYKPFLEILGASCRKYGHRHIVITDDPDLDIGDSGEKFVTEMPRNLMKALIKGQHSYLCSEFAEDDTVLLGADCVLARDPAEVFAREFDIAFTTGRFSDCILNTGAIYVRGAAPVAHIWDRALAQMGEDWGDDQIALANVVHPTIEESVVAGPGPTIRFIPVDPYNLAPEHPGDDCTRGYVLHFRGPRKAWMKDYCAKWLGIGEQVQWTILPNMPAEARFAHVEINSRRDLPWIDCEVEPHDGHAVIIGGGPSLTDTLGEIRYRAEQGQTLFALNGVAQWLVGKGLVADYQVLVDPREENVKFVRPACADAYLVASQCHPLVFDYLRRQEVTLFHHAEEGIENYFKGNPITIGGGITSGLVSMALVYAMGYRKIHLYGYDSSDREGVAHAYEQSESRQDAERREVWLDDRKFICAPAMYAQARAFPSFAKMLLDYGCLITVNGDGLLPSIARKMAGNPLQEG